MILAAPAHAQPCTGCNLVDNGDLGNLRIGQTVYVDSPYSADGGVSVVAVDTSSRRVHVRHSSGNVDWHYAVDLDTSSEVNKRDEVTTWATAGAVTVGLLALMFGGGDSNSSSGGANYATSISGAKCEYYEDYGQAPAPSYSSKPDTSVGCVWGDRSSGACR